MSTKLFCDRCGGEIVPVKGKRVSFELTVTRDETVNESTNSEETLRKDLCRACLDAVVEFIRNDK
jgi:hypothetical protein